MRRRAYGTYCAELLQLTYKTRENLAVKNVLDGHTNVHLGGRDEVDDNAEPIECAEYTRQEAMANALAVALNVQHNDTLFDRDRRGELARSLRLDPIRERERKMRRVYRASAHVQWL